MNRLGRALEEGDLVPSRQVTGSCVFEAFDLVKEIGQTCDLKRHYEQVKALAGQPLPAVFEPARLPLLGAHSTSSSNSI
jgi:hypothetical protein